MRLNSVCPECGYEGIMRRREIYGVVNSEGVPVSNFYICPECKTRLVTMGSDNTDAGKFTAKVLRYLPLEIAICIFGGASAYLDAAIESESPRNLTFYKVLLVMFFVMVISLIIVLILSATDIGGAVEQRFCKRLCPCDVGYNCIPLKPDFKAYVTFSSGIDYEKKCLLLSECTAYHAQYSNEEQYIIVVSYKVLGDSFLCSFAIADKRRDVRPSQSFLLQAYGETGLTATAELYHENEYSISQ